MARHELMFGGSDPTAKHKLTEGVLKMEEPSLTWLQSDSGYQSVSWVRGIFSAMPIVRMLGSST